MNRRENIHDISQSKLPNRRIQAEGIHIEGAKDKWIQVLEEVPAKLKQAVEVMTDSQLDTPYRDGGWTVRQVVHHLADSHMNSYIRFKLSLTEETPAIRPYDEKAWSELKDSKTADPSGSLALCRSFTEDGRLCSAP